MYRVKSKSSGSYFGSFKSKSAADAAAGGANAEEKYGADDWESEERPEAKVCKECGRPMPE